MGPNPVLSYDIMLAAAVFVLALCALYAAKGAGRNRVAGS